MTKQQGVSLVELMISALLASLLLALVLQQYLVSKRQYLRLYARLEQDIELQTINDLLRDSIRKAGFTPCRGINSLQSIDRRNGKTALAAVATSVGKRDGLAITRMSEDFTTVMRRLNPKQLLLRSNVHFAAQQVILIADCYHAEVQPVLDARKTSAGTILTLSNNLAFDYIDPIYLGEWLEEAFFIQKNQQGKSALFYQFKRPEELSDQIVKLIVDLKSYRGNDLVAVRWGFKNSKTMDIETEVRAG